MPHLKSYKVLRNELYENDKFMQTHVEKYIITNLEFRSTVSFEIN